MHVFCICRYLAGQMIGLSQLTMTSYTCDERSKTVLEHSVKVRYEAGYRSFSFSMASGSEPILNTVLTFNVISAKCGDL